MITFQELKNPIKFNEYHQKYTLNYQNQTFSISEVSKLLPSENHNELLEQMVLDQIKPTCTHQVLVSYEEGQIFTLKVLTATQMLLLQDLIQQGSPKVKALSEAFYICEYTGERSFVDVIHQLFLKQLFAKVNYDLPFNEDEMEYDKELFPNS